MKNMTLKRLDHMNPERETLDAMEQFFGELNVQCNYFSDEEWLDTVHQLVEFQAEDGSFNLLDSYQIESDCAIFYCYEPTYSGTAFLIKAILRDPDILTGKEDIILSRALKACCKRRFMGHGFDWLRDMIKAVGFFVDADVKSFLEKYPTLCPEFTTLFEELKEYYATCVLNGNFYDDFGQSYQEEIEAYNNYFSSHNIFVYGTLMKGQSNHNYFLYKSKFLGTGKISGYEMYDLGSFPGIIPGNGTVEGEVYNVTDYELQAINRLEGEGSLYIKTRVNVKMDNGKTISGSAYVYNDSVEGCPKLNARYGLQENESDEYVWYVSYGSNLLSERLKYYIQGGYCMYNGREYRPCTDTTMPTESRPVMIPYDMYYSNYGMGSWENSAVSFLDLSYPGKAYGRAYKIKRSQLSEIHAKEGKGANWYPECVRLDDIDGLEAYTFAGHQVKRKEPFSRVSAEYGIVLFMGMKETYPEMSNEEIFEYIKEGWHGNCMKETFEFLSQEWLNKYIDRGFHYAIRELNNKGYKTSNCCEGHYSEKYGYYMGAYIKFSHKIPNALFPKTPTFPVRDDNIVHSKYKTPIMEIGGGYKQDSNKPYEDAFYWTGTRYKRVSREEKDLEHEQFLKELNAWVDSLPPYESLPKEIREACYR